MYVDYPSGNWCEGLTAYLADHLMKEGEGRGAEYRRDVLKKFGSYVQEGLDFPLSEFRSRHSGATEAVGYGKCLMLWHMIRQSVGDEAFKKGLQAFYSDFLHRRASFDQVGSAQHPQIHADVILDPSAGSISWKLSLHQMGKQFEFSLHSGLTPQLDSAGSITLVGQSEQHGASGIDPQRPVDQKIWRVTVPENLASDLPVFISAAGVIREDLQQVGSGAGRSFSATPGTIDEQGVYLSGATAWYPHPEGKLVTFSMSVTLPAGWDAVSQGTRLSKEAAPDGTTVHWGCCAEPT